MQPLMGGDSSKLALLEKQNDLQKTMEALQTRITALETDATSFDNAWTHRTKFRGKSLGNALTADQKAAIKAGTFKDLYLGDYWSINDHTWRIADMDYWYGSGNISCTTHHVVVIPDSQLYTHNMNTQNVTTGGYTGSEMYTSGLDQAKKIVTQDFGTNVLSHRELFTNEVASGHPSNGTWFDSTVDLPNEIMMYGSYVLTPGVTDTVVPYLYTIDKTQLALMQVAPFYINPARQDIWLRDVVSTFSFAHVDDRGIAYENGAINVYGVRPVVGITG